MLVGHAGDLELAVARLVERPAGFVEQQVDEVVAGLRLVVVVGVGPGRVGGLRRGDLGAQLGDLGVEGRRSLLARLGQRGVPGGELLGQRLELGLGLGRTLGWHRRGSTARLESQGLGGRAGLVAGVGGRASTSRGTARAHRTASLGDHRPLLVHGVVALRG